MIGLITRWLLTALALILTTKIVPGIQVASITTLFVASLVLGLFILIIKGFTFWLAAHFVPGFHVNNFGAALLGAIVVSLLSFVFSFFIKTGEKLAR